MGNEYVAPDSTDVNITHINNTEADLITNLQTCQLGIANDINGVIIKDKDSNAYVIRPDKISNGTTATETTSITVTNSVTAVNDGPLDVLFKNAVNENNLPVDIASVSFVGKNTNNDDMLYAELVARAESIYDPVGRSLIAIRASDGSNTDGLTLCNDNSGNGLCTGFGVTTPIHILEVYKNTSDYELQDGIRLAVGATSSTVTKAVMYANAFDRVDTIEFNEAGASVDVVGFGESTMSAFSGEIILLKNVAGCATYNAHANFYLSDDTVVCDDHVAGNDIVAAAYSAGTGKLYLIWNAANQTLTFQMADSVDGYEWPVMVSYKIKIINRPVV